MWIHFYFNCLPRCGGKANQQSVLTSLLRGPLIVVFNATLSRWAVFFHWQSPMQQLHFYTGTSNTRLPPPHPRHPLNTAVREILFEPKSDLWASTQKPHHTPVPLRVKAAAPLPHELKGPWHLCPAPLLSCPIWSLSGLLPCHTGYLAFLQHSKTCQSTWPGDLLLCLPSPLFPHLPQKWLNNSSQECPSYNGDPSLRHRVSDPSSAYSPLLPTSHHLNSLAYYLMPVLVPSSN